MVHMWRLMVPTNLDLSGSCGSFGGICKSFDGTCEAMDAIFEALDGTFWFWMYHKMDADL